VLTAWSDSSNFTR